MITFLTIPRPFTGEFDALQRMAIRSWKGADPRAQIILFGNESGIANAAQELGVTLCRDLLEGEYGPLIDRVFSLGERYASQPWLCFCSADVVLDGVRETIAVVGDTPRPFIIGQRWDIEPNAPASTATLHPACGVDYFLYRRGTLGVVPAFSVRGGGGDQWLLWKALTAWNMTVIDATEMITAIHVNHSHPEWPNGKIGRQGSAAQAYNRQLYEQDGLTKLCGVDDAPWILRDGKVMLRHVPTNA